MDIKAYIESGKLEAYALGFCSEEEAAEVGQLCAQYPELNSELEAIRFSVERYAESHAKKAPDLKGQIMAAINEVEQVSAPEQEQHAAKVITLYSRLRKISIAAIALFVISFSMNVILYKRWKNVNEELVALNTRNSQLASEFRSNQVRLETMHNDLAVISDPNTVKVMMKGIEAKSPASLAMIYWNKQSRQVFLEVKTLPVPEAGKQYQLWAIVDGKPVDAGMITMTEGDTSLHPMKDFETAQAFAITLEKAGGSPAPTLTEMYVMGAVSL